MKKDKEPLSITHPEIAKEAYGWDPKYVVAGTNKKFYWKCPLEHIYEATGNKRVMGRNCPYCSNQKVLAGFNDLATTHPELAKEAHNWDPSKVVAGSKKKKAWKCNNDHEWEASISNRALNESACPYCTNKKVLAGFNDLATTHPELAKEARNWNPKLVTSGSGKLQEWQCTQKHLWLASPHNRAGKNSDCPSCSITGFNPNKSAYLYFLLQPVWKLYQIGITNIPDERLGQHKKNEFELIELHGPIAGHTAQKLETAILRFLKSQNADLSPEHIAGKFDGYSESWTIDSFRVNNLKELIDKASEAGF
jgi:uncharacterized Zn-finger protein